MNPLLEATGARAVAIRLAQNSILGFADPRVMLWPSSFAADPHVAKWHEPLNLKKLGRFRVSYAADAAQYAASLGVALYIGSGTELHKVRWNNFDTAQQISWTGNPSAATVGREVNLTPYERLIIARLLRAYFGQENAFCDVATPSNPEAGDLMSLWDFDSDIRRLISLLPDRLSKRYPDHPPMEAAGSGYLTDADLLTLLTLIEDEVAIVEGHAVHRKNTECVMEMRSLGEYMRDTPPGVKVIETTGYDLALGRANSMYEDALGVRNLSPDENSHVRVAVDGNAVGYKCAKVALIRVSPGGKVQRLCDKTLP